MISQDLRRRPAHHRRGGHRRLHRPLHRHPPRRGRADRAGRRHPHAHNLPTDGASAHCQAVAPAAGPPDPDVPVGQVPAPRPVLGDGRYDAYINKVDAGRHQVVVDLVQVFQGQAAVQAAIADGTPRDRAQYLSVYVRNQNPRLRTLPLARDVRIDLWRTCDGPKPVSVLLAKLASNARLGWYYYTLTVTDGTVHQITETFKGNAC